MRNIKKRFQNAVSFIKGFDREYIQNKWTQFKSLKREDYIEFFKRSRKPLLAAAGAVAAILIIIPIITYIYFVRDLSSKERIINKKNEGVILLDRNDKPFFTLFDATTKNPVAIDKIPDHTKQAFIAIEDKEFYNHPGFSITGLIRAVRENILSEPLSQGGSTISQQLMKNTLLTPEKQLLRKYQELVLAIELERRYTKDDILEMYLNSNYFGEGAFGIQDASKRYFSKDVSALTLAESALLSAIIQAPSYYSPITGDKEAAYKRKNLVLELMAQQGYISQAEKKAAQEEEIVFNPTSSDINDEAVHFALMIQDFLIDEYGEQSAAQSGFVVKTTIDLSLQKAAQEAVSRQVQSLAGLQVTNGAAVVMDPKTGEVLALVGSHDWNNEDNGKINMAIRPRQPGSSFKPIIYARAIDRRFITASTQLTDEPIKYGDYEPKNYDNRFRGKVSTRKALALSLNIPAVQVMNMVGVEDGVKQAKALGITTLDEDRDYGLPMVLGSAEVPLIEMTNVYATFANQGEWNDYDIFLEVRDKNGKVILEKTDETRRALSESVAYIISSILSDAPVRAEVFGNSLTISRTAAVKTGTTNDYKDSLTMGYTPQVAVGVWIGNNDNKEMNAVAGSSGAGPIWRAIMEAALAGKPVENFVKPAAVIEETVCREDGLLIDKNVATTSAYLEYYIRGTKPTKMCGIIPTPTPTKTDEQKKQDEEEKKKKEEEERKLSQTPTPTNTPVPSPTSVATPTDVVPTAGPTSTPIITITPTDVIPTL